MRDEMVQVGLAIEERDNRCTSDIKSIESRISSLEKLKSQVINEVSALSPGEKKELSKVEAFREHSVALKRHIENTGNYLRREVKSVEQKIEEAKELMLKEVGVKVEDIEATDAVLSDVADKTLVKEILEELEDDDEDSHIEPEPPLQPPTPQ